MANHFDKYDPPEQSFWEKLDPRNPEGYLASSLGTPGTRTDALARGLITGATWGLGNKAQAVARSATGPGTYEQYRNEQDLANANAQKAHGNYYTAGNIVGGIPAIVATGGAPITSAVAMGATHGAGQTGKDTGQVAENALKGGAVGLVAGGAAKLLGGFAGWLQDKVGSKVAAQMTKDELKNAQSAYQDEIEAWKQTNMSTPPPRGGNAPVMAPKPFEPGDPLVTPAGGRIMYPVPTKAGTRLVEQASTGDLGQSAKQAVPQVLSDVSQNAENVAPISFQSAVDVASSAAKSALPTWAKFGLAAGGGLGGEAGQIAGGWLADKAGIPHWIGSAAGGAMGAGLGGYGGVRTTGGAGSSLPATLVTNPGATEAVARSPMLATGPAADAATGSNYFDRYDTEPSGIQQLLNRFRTNQ